jgi:hypothetical protein
VAEIGLGMRMGIGIRLGSELVVEEEVDDVLIILVDFSYIKAEIHRQWSLADVPLRISLTYPYNRR